MTVAPATTVRRAPVRLRHRRSARRLSEGQLADLREAVKQAQRSATTAATSTGPASTGCPPPYCRHGDQLFLPWHRAYLYFFEKALQDQVPASPCPGGTGEDHGEALPAAYARARTAEGKANPLSSSPIQPSGRRQPSERRTWREPGDASWLPTGDQVTRVRQNRDYFTFQSQLESLHNGVHGYVGGTMGFVATSAYDPIFWAHHCMIDRLWYLWQLDHPGARLPARYLDLALPPFEMTVRDTLDVTALGYDYAAASAAVPGTSRG